MSLLGTVDDMCETIEQRRELFRRDQFVLAAPGRAWVGVAESDGELQRIHCVRGKMQVDSLLGAQ